MDHTTSFSASDGTKVVAFETGWFPFANAHYTPMTVDGQRYNSVLHYMLCQKAKLMKDEDSYMAIKNAKGTAAQCKAALDIKEGSNIFNAWGLHEERYLNIGINEKLAQYPRIHKQLKETGNTTIAYATRYDSNMGAGYSLGDEDLLDTEKWGNNMLGKTLMEFRKKGYDTFN
jgi:ribA/ribD-fused uncharacterized protein